MSNPDGRPWRFKNVEALQPLIDQYFENVPEEEWTVTGLALALKTTRQVLMDYQERDQFTDSIKQAKLKVESSYEKSLKRRGNAGDIFGLKNFGWHDKQEVEHSGGINIDDIDDEELDRRIEALRVQRLQNGTRAGGGADDPRSAP